MVPRGAGGGTGLAVRFAGGDVGVVGALDETGDVGEGCVVGAPGVVGALGAVGGDVTGDVTGGAGRGWA